MKESVRPHENQSTGRTVATPVTDTAVDAPTVTLRTSRQTERIDERNMERPTRIGDERVSGKHVYRKVLSVQLASSPLQRELSHRA